MISRISHPSRPRLLATLVAGGVLALIGSGSALAVDWSKVPEKDVTLFYPGQASWEWVLTATDHSGAPKFRAGKNCKACHDGEQATMGGKIASGAKLEPQPIAGKPGSVGLKVQVAHDAGRLYFRFRWTAGTKVTQKLDADNAARVTVMIDDGSVKEAARAGCWGSCHDDAKGMASAAGADRTKYLGASRAKLTRQGGGDNLKAPADIAALLTQGAFLEYWQARMSPGKPAEPVSGYILDQRHENAPSKTVAAQATFADGAWTVELSGPLAASGTGEKAIAAGKTYNIGFAVHDEYANHRYHFVSFEQTLTLDGGSADFVAKGF